MDQGKTVSGGNLSGNKKKEAIEMRTLYKCAQNCARQVDQRYSFQIKDDPARIHLQVRRELFQMLRLQSAAQPN